MFQRCWEMLQCDSQGDWKLAYDYVPSFLSFIEVHPNALELILHVSNIRSGGVDSVLRGHHLQVPSRVIVRSQVHDLSLIHI